MANLSKTAKITTAVIVLFLLSLMTACSNSMSGAPFSARVEIIGDVADPYLFTGENFSSYKITDDVNKYTAIAVKDIIGQSNPISSDYSILFIGRDGLTSEIDGADLEGCHLAYTDDLGWQHISEYHPISSRVKLLDKIVIVAKDTLSLGTNFAGNTFSTCITPGSIYKNNFESLIIKSGQSEINNRYVAVYTKDVTVGLKTLMDFEKTVAVFTEEGDVIYDRPNENSRIVIEKKSISYIKSSGEKAEKVKGILADPPLSSITDTYDDVIRLTENGDRVMVIELDGFGSMIADVAKENNYLPFLSQYQMERAMAVYPTVSTAGLAAMVTGKNGSENGIISRRHRELLCSDIFEYLSAQGKKSVYIEGDIGLIQTSLSPILSMQKEKPDDSVFENTMLAIGKDSDFIFTHFHSIDDLATTYGPYAEKTMNQIFAVDYMVSQLVEAFDGMIIITADHGLHTTETGGYHGIVSKEDSLVPYLILTGGKYEKTN